MVQSEQQHSIPIWRDERFVSIAFQVIVVLIVLGIVAFLGYNLTGNLEQLGIDLSFRFLDNEAGFGISEGLIPYDPRDTYWYAMFLGLLNSLQVIITGMLLTTVLGILAGVASFSDNWLLRQLSRVYVEIVRNTPLLLQLFVWYFAIFLGSLPRQGVLSLPFSIFMGRRGGVWLPWPRNTVAAWAWFVVLLVMATVAVFVWRSRRKLMEEQGTSGTNQRNVLIGLGVVGLLILAFALGWQFPQRLDENTVEGGLQITLEFLAAVVGLVFYTGAYIAEIVRGGIQAVSKGQWEAARTLGFNSGLVMQLVVFPQALRVIIPPLSSQYMNLAKNSTLASALAFPELYSISSTTLNQSGRAVQVFLILMSTYLIINLIISLVMNVFNQSVQLKER